MRIYISQRQKSADTEGFDLKFFVTGVNGRLGHDVMNELYKRGHEGVGSDLNHFPPGRMQ